VDAIHLPPGLTLPSAFGAPPAPLQVGQVIQALVLELIESDIFRLQLPQAVIDVRSSVPLTPGSTITLAVKGTGPSARLAIYSDVPPVPPAVRGPAPAPNLVGRTPIGEAIVIARTPGQSAGTTRNPTIGGDTTAAASATIRPAVLREAASSRPTPAARPAEAPVRVISPDQAVTDAIRTAAPRQAGLAPLFADLEQIAQAPSAAPVSTPFPVPTPVRQAAKDLLSFRVPLDEQLTVGDLKQAFVRSGVLFERRLAAARVTQIEAPANAAREIAEPAPTAPTPRSRSGTVPTAAAAHVESAAAPTAHDDLKAALIVFRQVLKAWGASEPARAAQSPDAPLGKPAASGPAVMTQAPAPSPNIQTITHVASLLARLPGEVNKQAVSPEQASLSPEQATTLAKSLATALVTRDTPAAPSPPSNALPPPYRGAPPTAQAVAAPSLGRDAAPDEVASRLITETDGALARTTLLQVASLPEQPDQPRAAPTQRWNFEVPFATPQGTAIAQFEVSRDGPSLRADPQARTWRARFSLDLEPLGPVHALIALAGVRTSVTLWAERASTAARLNQNAAMLSDALRAAELEPVDFSARPGAPPVVRQAAPGRFMDRAS
jgi:hypothetical protein